MKTLKKQEYIDQAIELSHVISERKTLEKRESELKDLFKGLASGEPAIKCGDVLIIFSLCERESLDRKSLELHFGAEAISEFVKITEYVKTEVKAGA
jgi:hypothetical protein